MHSLKLISVINILSPTRFCTPAHIQFGIFRGTIAFSSNGKNYKERFYVITAFATVYLMGTFYGKQIHKTHAIATCTDADNIYVATV